MPCSLLSALPRDEDGLLDALVILEAGGEVIFRILSLFYLFFEPLESNFLRVHSGEKYSSNTLVIFLLLGEAIRAILPLADVGCFSPFFDKRLLKGDSLLGEVPTGVFCVDCFDVRQALFAISLCLEVDFFPLFALSCSLSL